MTKRESPMIDRATIGKHGLGSMTTLLAICSMSAPPSPRPRPIAPNTAGKPTPTATRAAECRGWGFERGGEAVSVAVATLLMVPRAQEPYGGVELRVSHQVPHGLRLHLVTPPEAS